MGSGHRRQARNGSGLKRVAPTASRSLFLACIGFCIGLPMQALGQSAPVSAPAATDAASPRAVARATAGGPPGLAATTTLSLVASSPEATLLRQIQQAARHLNYEGVFTFQQGEAIESSRLVHVFDGQDEKERIEVLDGPPREYLRLNDEVQSLLPEQKIILREQQRGDRFPGLLLSDPNLLEAHYQLRLAPELYRVAGRACRVIEIVPRDAHRYGYRLCADSTSHLLLKAQTLTGEGAVLEQVAFTHVTIGQVINEQALQPSWPTTGWSTQHTKQQVIDLGALGWRVPAPPGYLPTSQLARVFAEQRTVNQLVLSDGLATISIFIEPYRAERSEYLSQGASRSGSVNIFGIRIANFWLTVLGEVPAATLELLAQSIQYVPPAGSR
jgi:sigma-E factor negative regulatory protein RseB